MPILILLAVVISGIFNASAVFINGQAKKAAGVHRSSAEIKETSTGKANGTKMDTTTVILIS